MKGALKNKLQDGLLFAGYFIINLLCFYRRDLFFCLDDYIVIWSWARARSIIRYLLAPHNEHFVPLAKLFYALEIVSFREHYGLFILTNCALMAMTALLWSKFLQRLGSPAWLAIAIPLLACTSTPSEKNIMLAWQSGLILSAASLVGAVWAYLDKRLYACFFFAAVSALTFSSAIPVCLALGGFLLLDGFVTKDRRLLMGGCSMLALFGFLIACERIIEGLIGVGPSFRQTFWNQPTFWINLGHLTWLAYYTLSIALAGPFLQLYWQLAGGHASENVPLLAAALGFGAAALLLLLVWRSSVRRLVIQLVVLQVALFVFIGPFRQTGGLAARYYTAGSIPLFSAAAVAAYAVASRARWRLEWMALPLAAIIGVNLTRIAVQGDARMPVQLGRAARLDYYSTKSWLLRHQGEVIPNHSGTRWIAPWFNTAQMITMIPVLDPSFSFPPTVYREVHYLENLDATRPWATNPGYWEIEQTFRFDHPEVLTKFELWSGAGRNRGGNVEIAWMDGGHPLWSMVIPGNQWPNGVWFGLPVDMIHLLPATTYVLRVRRQSPLPGDQLNLMMNGDPASYPRGETRTPDGSVGDLCFRLALLD
jgi:hypothetical protein